MNLELKGNWNIVKGKLKEKYGLLSEDDLTLVKGEEDQLVGVLQKKLHKSKEEVVDELNEMITSLK